MDLGKQCCNSRSIGAREGGGAVSSLFCLPPVPLLCTIIIIFVVVVVIFVVVAAAAVVFVINTITQHLEFGIYLESSQYSCNIIINIYVTTNFHDSNNLSLQR